MHILVDKLWDGGSGIGYCVFCVYICPFEGYLDMYGVTSVCVFQVFLFTALYSPYVGFCIPSCHARHSHWNTI